MSSALKAAFMSCCRFFSSLIQRSAKVHRRLKGGSMTMLAILPGQPAKGERQPQSRGPQDYPNLSPQQREKLLAALQKQQPAKAETPVGWARTEVCISSVARSAFFYARFAAITCSCMPHVSCVPSG